MTAGFNTWIFAQDFKIDMVASADFCRFPYGQRTHDGTSAGAFGFKIHIGILAAEIADDRPAHVQRHCRAEARIDHVKCAIARNFQDSTVRA